MTAEELKAAEERIAKAKAAWEMAQDAIAAANIMSNSGSGQINFYTDGDIRVSDDRGTARIIKGASFELRQAVAKFLTQMSEVARKEWEAL